MCKTRPRDSVRRPARPAIDRLAATRYASGYVQPSAGLGADGTTRRASRIRCASTATNTVTIGYPSSPDGPEASVTPPASAPSIQAASPAGPPALTGPPASDAT